MEDTAQSRSRVVGKPKTWYRRKVNDIGPEEIVASTSKAVGDASATGEGVTSNAVVKASNRGPKQSLFKFNFRKPKATPIKTLPAVDPASQITSSNPVPTPDSSPVLISKSSHEMNPSSSGNNGPPVKKDLWQRAYDELGADKDNKIWIERYESLVKSITKDDENMPNDSGVEQQMAAFVRTRMKVMTNKQWMLQWGSRSFSIRQQVDRIVKVIQSVSSIGSAAASLDPLHAGIAWAGICVVLPSKLAETGLEKITKKIYYLVEMENFYWSAENVVRNSHFEDALVKLYREILTYESKCAWYFSLRTPNRTVRNLLKIDGWADLIKDIDACENHCLQFNHILSHANQAKFQAVLSQQLEDIQLSLNRRYEIESQNKEVITWVSKVAVFDDHVNVRKSKLGSAYWNSGKWLLQKQEFIDWKKSSHGQFWLRGTVGTGKTCLTSIVISHLIETVADERLAIFYCSGEKEYNRPIDVLRSLVAQLSWSIDGEVIPLIKAFYTENAERHPDGSILDLDQCVSFLVELSKFHGYTTIAIDALDECTDPRGLLMCLETVCGRSEKLKLFFSSRDGVSVHEQFPDCLQVRADTPESRGDIQDFIEGELRNPKRRNPKVITDEMANRLKGILIKRAGGMFRWVELQLALFISVERPIKNPTDVEIKLKALESSTGEKIMVMLRKAYDDIYQRNTEDQPHSQELARRALKWILCSFRTLKIDELQHAIAVNKDMTETWVRENSGYLLDICSNFIVVDQYKNVQLAHQSVREYLEKREHYTIQEFAVVETHAQAAESCLNFLNHSDTDIHQITQFDDGLGFPGYAVLYWAEHCRLAGTNRTKSGLGIVFGDFLLKAEPNAKFAGWTRKLKAVSSSGSLGRKLTLATSSPPDPFFAACVWGFHEVLQHSLRTEWVNSQEHRNRGLVIACEYGHTDIVEMLLKADPKANVDARNDDSWTALHLAAEFGHTDIVEMLLKADPKANVDARNNDSWTALHFAVRRGHAGIVKMLIEADPKANVNARNKDGNTALHFAVRRGHAGIIKILLEADPKANIDALYLVGSTPLHDAVREGCVEIVKILLKAKADINKEDHGGSTPLYYAIEDGNVEIVRILLEAKANINAKDHGGSTPLYYAIRFEYRTVEIVKILLEADPRANIKSLYLDGGTPLHYAIRYGRVESVKVLLEADPKANINAVDYNGSTPLHFAIHYRRVEIVKILLETDPKADINALDKKGMTPLDYAVRDRDYQSIKALLRPASAPESRHMSLAAHPDSDGNDLVDSLKYLILKRPNDSKLYTMLGNEYLRLEKCGEAKMAFDKSMYLKMKELKARRIEDIRTDIPCDECGVSIVGGYYKRCGWTYNLCQVCLQNSNYPSTDLIMIPSEKFVADTD